MSILIPLFSVISCQSKPLFSFLSFCFFCHLNALNLTFFIFYFLVGGGGGYKLTNPLPILCFLELSYPFVDVALILFEGFEEHKSGVWRRKHRANGFGFTSCSWWWRACHWVSLRLIFLFLNVENTTEKRKE